MYTMHSKIVWLAEDRHLPKERIMIEIIKDTAK
jgi:hypothetical protein